MKQYVYEVGGFEFIDTRAFGSAWQTVKAKATIEHLAIYRTIVRDGDTIGREVYTTAGIFLPVEMVMPEEVKIF